MNKTSEGHASSVRICAEVAEVGHTKGMLFAERIPATFNPRMDGFQLVGSTPDGFDLMTVALCTVNEADEANAARLVACWNSCDGIPTKVLESIPGVMKATLPYHELKAQRNELLAALQGLDEAYCRAGSPLTKDERTEDRKRLIAAREAIAKATP